MLAEKGDNAEEVEISLPVEKGPPSEKGFYLFSQGKIQSVYKNDYSKIKKYISRRLSEYQSPLMIESTAVLPKPSSLAPGAFGRTNIELFWQKQIQNLSLRYRFFCQENTYQSSKVISGLEKFPI